MPDAENKLDRVLEAISALRESYAAMAANMNGFQRTSDRHEREMDASRQRHDRDIETVLLRAAAIETAHAAVAARVAAAETTTAALVKLREDVDALKERPPGLTGKQLLAGAASIAGFVLILMQITQFVIKAVSG